jgi:hypothetical protein
LSSPAGEARWRQPVAKSFFVSGFAAPVASCSGSVVTATEVTDTAVHSVVTKPFANTGAWPTVVTSKVLRDGSIIETVSEHFVDVVGSREKA